ncbi:hypothetical protein DINM_004903 [Dirofilaria immitis]|nr:hypothetical protein [Dirofilaria immitis]
MKLVETVLVTLLMQMVETNRHCHRYHYCVNKARNDYEQCLGGVAAAIIADIGNLEIINILLEQSDRVDICENQLSQEIKNYQVARQHENEDILKCINVFITHPSFKHISDIKKIACTETPSSWNLRDLIGDNVMKPSQCREIYDLQIQRCLFLLSCCPVYSLCVASVSLNSTIHNKVISLKKKIASDADQCLSPDFAMMNEGPIQKHLAERILITNITPSNDCVEKMRCAGRADLNKSEINAKFSDIFGFLNPEKRVSLSKDRKGRAQIRDFYWSTIYKCVKRRTHCTFTSVATTLAPSQDNVSLTIKETLPLPKLSTLSLSNRRFTEPTTISLNRSHMIDASPDYAILGSNETLESQLLMSENDGKNGSQISLVDSQIWNILGRKYCFCEETLVCEEKLKLRELMCQRQCAYPNLILESKTKLFDMSVQAEIITNSRVADITESVSKACMRPVTSDVLQQLSKLLHKMELNRKSCMRRIASNQNLLSIHNKTLCEEMMTYEAFDEKNDIDKDKCSNLTTRKNAFDYCKTIVAPIEEQCMTLRQCCPSYVRCAELMVQTNTSRKYNEMLSRMKEIQNKCEKKIMATLRSLHSSFSSFAHNENTGDC